MSISHTTIQDAINRGLKLIALPSRLIFLSALGLCIILLVLGYSWWNLLLLPFGILLSSLYTRWTMPRWRIWAYMQANDIHQLQRSAELAGLLKKQSHDSVGGFMSSRQRETLSTLQKRFLEDSVFVDDSSIPDETCIYPRVLFPSLSSSDPILILNDTGIRIQSEGSFEWDQIENDRIAQISFGRMNPRTGMDTYGGTKDVFRFEYPLGRFEIPIGEIGVSAWKLDLLLYVYRGRSTLQPAIIIPNTKS